MTILHTETLKKWGGQQNRVLTEAVGLSKKGHRVIIACHKGSILAQRAKEADIKVYEVNMVKQAHMITIPGLINIIKKEGVEIVSTHSSVDSWAGGIAAKLTGRKLLRFRHNIYPIGRDLLTRLIYSIPDRIVAISDSVKDVLIKGGFNSKKIMVIPSSVDTEIFNPEVEDLRKELKISPETIVIGNTSTFTEVKGQEFLLQAFNNIYKNFPCILLFAGRLREPFKNKYLLHVKKELREKVVFLGHREDIPRVLKTIDIFVYPSILEGLGTALLEAMAMEKPVVVSDIPTFRNFIVDGVNGLFFKAKDPEDMAEKVLSHMDMDKESLKERLGKNARSTILENFSLDKMLSLTEALYREILNAR
ncbi:MAG: glycosyltransferase family 4 protein [Nitrospirota bacterium]